MHHQKKDRVIGIECRHDFEPLKISEGKDGFVMYSDRFEQCIYCYGLKFI